jgi:hypothetical protein
MEFFTDQNGNNDPTDNNSQKDQRINQQRNQKICLFIESQMQASTSDFYISLSAKKLYTGGDLVSPSQSSLPSPSHFQLARYLT